MFAVLALAHAQSLFCGVELDVSQSVISYPSPITKGVNLSMILNWQVFCGLESLAL